MGAHTWHDEPPSETPVFDDLLRELFERWDAEDEQEIASEHEPTKD